MKNYAVIAVAPELIRSYSGYMRADIPGLKQGIYCNDNSR